MKTSNTVNPLHAAPPLPSEIIFKDGFRLLNSSLGLIDFGSIDVRLTQDRIWLTGELSIPLNLIQRVELVEGGWIFKMHAIRLVYFNPAAQQLEAVPFSKVDFLGLCDKTAVVQFHEVLKTMVATIQRESAANTQEESQQESAVSELSTPQQEPCCEKCGKKPCYYVSYIYLMSFIMISFRSGEERRVHCSDCIIKTGVPYYLMTMLLGWIGIGIFAYPMALYQSALNLKPAIGNKYLLLFIAPLLGVVLIVLHLFNVI